MVGPIAALENFFFKAFDFSGRATRAEFWWVFLFLGIAIVAALVMDIVTISSTDYYDVSPMSLLTPWLFLLTFIPFLSLRVRRLHDISKSGFWLLLDGIPLVGPIITLVMLSMPSHPDHNAWGQAPQHSFAGGASGASGHGEFTSDAVSQSTAEKPHNAFQSYAYLVNGESEPTSDMIEKRRNEIKDYYRARVLGQGA